MSKKCVGYNCRPESRSRMQNRDTDSLESRRLDPKLFNLFGTKLSSENQDPVADFSNSCKTSLEDWRIFCHSNCLARNVENPSAGIPSDDQNFRV